MTEAWGPRKWLEGASPETADAAERPERRTHRSAQRSGRGGNGASWPRARFSGGAGERPRGQTMRRRDERRGFSRRVGLGVSGTTATARFFDSEAAAPAPGTIPLRSLSLYPVVDK